MFEEWSWGLLKREGQGGISSDGVAGQAEQWGFLPSIVPRWVVGPSIPMAQPGCRGGSVRDTCSKTTVEAGGKKQNTF